MNENGDCINPPIAPPVAPVAPAESQEKVPAEMYVGPVGGPDSPTKCYSPGTRDYNHDGCVCKVMLNSTA